MTTCGAFKISHPLGTVMKRKYISTTLILAFTVNAPFTSTLALAQPHQTEQSATPIKVRIEVDAQSVGDRGKGLEAVMIDNLREPFAASGADLVDADAADASVLRIRFGGKPEDVQVFHYQLEFDLIDGDTATRLMEPLRCKSCFDHVLFERLEALAPSLIEAIEAKRSASAATDGGTDVHSVTPPNGEHAGTNPAQKPKAVGPLGMTGAVGLGVGIGLSIGGAVVVTEPRQRIIESYAEFGNERDRTSLGVGLLVPGVTLVIAGAVMLAVDVSKRAKQRKRHENVTVVPTLSPTSAGLGVFGRF